MGGSRGSTIVWAVSLTDVRVFRRNDTVNTVYSRSRIRHSPRELVENNLGRNEFPNSEEQLHTSMPVHADTYFLSYQAFLTDLT